MRVKPEEEDEGEDQEEDEEEAEKEDEEATKEEKEEGKKNNMRKNKKKMSGARSLISTDVITSSFLFHCSLYIKYWDLGEMT